MDFADETKRRRWPFRLQFGIRSLLLLVVPVAIWGTMRFNARPLAWEEYSDARLDDALASGRPVVLFFYYEWDVTAAFLEQVTLSHQRFKNAVRWHRFVPLRVDCSKSTKSCAALRLRFNFVPGSDYFALIHPKQPKQPKQPDLVVLHGVLDAKTLATELKQLTNHHPSDTGVSSNLQSTD